MGKERSVAKKSCKVICQGKSPTMSVIIVNINELSFPIMVQRILEWIKSQNLDTHCLKVAYLK